MVVDKGKLELANVIDSLYLRKNQGRSVKRNCSL